MSQILLTDFISRQVGCLGGASRIDFTEPWTRKHYLPQDSTSGEICIGWAGINNSDFQILHGIRIHRPELTTEAAWKPVFLRAVCHWFVDQIPDEGMPEILGSLYEFRDYYRTPLMEAAPKAVRSAPGLVGNREVRPEFEFDEE